MRRFLLLGLLLATPLLAHADALSGLAVLFQLLAFVAGLALLAVVFIVWAYFRPASRTLQVLSGVFVALSLLLGVAWHMLFKQSTSLGFLSFNPFLELIIPLAAWLGGVRLATNYLQPIRRLLGVSVAVFAAGLLLSPLVRWLLEHLMQEEAYVRLVGPGVFTYLVWWPLHLALLFGIWWMVLEQAQRRQPLAWQQPRLALLASAVEMGFSVAYSLLFVLVAYGTDMQWLGIFSYMGSVLGYGVVGWGVGAWAIWLNQRRHPLVEIP